MVRSSSNRFERSGAPAPIVTEPGAFKVKWRLRTLAVSAFGLLAMSSFALAQPNLAPCDSMNVMAECDEADNSDTQTILVEDARIKPVVEPAPVAVVGRGEKPVVVMDSASRNISATNGGTITLPSGSRVTFPPGFLSGDQRVMVKRLSALPELIPSGLEVSAGPALEFEITVVPASLLMAPALFAATPSPKIGFSISLSGADLPDFEDAVPLAQITLPSAGYTTFVGAQFSGTSQKQAEIELPTSVIGSIAAALSHPGSTIRVAMGVARLLRLPGFDCGNRGPMRLDHPSDPFSSDRWNPVGNPCAGESVCGKHILVLVHGILSSVEKAFTTDGHCVEEIEHRGGYDQVLGFDYDYTEQITKSGEGLANLLNALVACCPPNNPPVIDVEAHSRGGLVTMAAIPLLNFTARNVVLLGSPLAGTDAAFFGPNFPSVLAARGAVADFGSLCYSDATLASLLAAPHFLADMTPESTIRQGVIGAAAQNPNYQNLYLAAGMQGSSATGWIFGSNTPNDGVVTVESALGSGIPLKRTPGGTATFGDNHIGLECDPEVQDWVAGKVNPSGSVAVDFFTADPATIAPGESSLLSWTTTNAASASINGEVTGLNGSKRVSPAATTTYTLVAEGPGGTATATATVTVTSGSLPPGIVFTANPTTIGPGQSSVLIWTTTNATSVSINGTAEPLNGSVSVSPSATGTYTLTATGPGGTATAQVTITVTGGTAPTVSFTITPSTVVEGQSFTLTWATTNATSVSIGGTAEPLNGSVAQSISSAGTYTYTLTAVGPGGTTTKTASVTVTSGSSGGDSVLALQFSKCQGSASPLPGWKNCPGIATVSITQPVSSGWISVFFNYPDDGSFYHGELHIGSTTGTFLVSVINEYESFCPASFDTIVDVYDASSSSGSGPLLVSEPFSIINHTCN